MSIENPHLLDTDSPEPLKIYFHFTRFFVQRGADLFYSEDMNILFPRTFWEASAPRLQKELHSDEGLSVSFTEDNDLHLYRTGHPDMVLRTHKRNAALLVRFLC